MNISWWHWFKNKLFKIVHLVMAAELLACHGAHITEKLQAGWKAQQRRVSRLKIPKCFMQAWCIIVREFKCVFSEPKLLTGWFFCRDTEMWTGMEKLLDILYMRFVGFFDFFFFSWSPIHWICKHFSHVQGVMSSCGRPCLGHWETSVLHFNWGSAISSLCWAHGSSLILKLLQYGYALNHNKNVISIQSYSQVSFREKKDDPWVDFQDQYEPTSMKDTLGSIHYVYITFGMEIYGSCYKSSSLLSIKGNQPISIIS